MNFVLIVAAVATAMNPLRLAAVSPVGRLVRRRATLQALGAISLVSLLLAWWSSPIIGSIDVSSSSATIAAGLALAVIGSRDTVVKPPVFEPMGGRVGVAVVPMFFPTLFNPAIAIMAIAAGAERGVGVTLIAVLLAAATVGLVAEVAALESVRSRPFWTRLAASVVGLSCVVVGALVATHGVMSI